MEMEGDDLVYRARTRHPYGALTLGFLLLPVVGFLFVCNGLVTLGVVIFLGTLVPFSLTHWFFHSRRLELRVTPIALRIRHWGAREIHVSFNEVESVDYFAGNDYWFVRIGTNRGRVDIGPILVEVMGHQEGMPPERFREMIAAIRQRAGLFAERKGDASHVPVELAALHVPKEP